MNEAIRRQNLALIWAGIGCLAILIGGLLCVYTRAAAAECSSAIGQVRQAFSLQAQNQCFDAGVLHTGGGLLCLAGTAVAVGAAIYGGNH
jgi:hypothetical protein